MKLYFLIDTTFSHRSLFKYAFAVSSIALSADILKYLMVENLVIQGSKLADAQLLCASKILFVHVSVSHHLTVHNHVDFIIFKKRSSISTFFPVKLPHSLKWQLTIPVAETEWQGDKVTKTKEERVFDIEPTINSNLFSASKNRISSSAINRCGQLS